MVLTKSQRECLMHLRWHLPSFWARVSGGWNTFMYDFIEICLFIEWDKQHHLANHGQLLVLVVGQIREFAVWQSTGYFLLPSVLHPLLLWQTFILYTATLTDTPTNTVLPSILPNYECALENRLFLKVRFLFHLLFYSCSQPLHCLAPISFLSSNVLSWHPTSHCISTPSC